MRGLAVDGTATAGDEDSGGCNDGDDAYVGFRARTVALWKHLGHMHTTATTAVSMWEFQESHDGGLEARRCSWPMELAQQVRKVMRVLDGNYHHGHVEGVCSYYQHCHLLCSQVARFTSLAAWSGACHIFAPMSWKYFCGFGADLEKEALSSGAECEDAARDDDGGSLLTYPDDEGPGAPLKMEEAFPAWWCSNAVRAECFSTADAYCLASTSVLHSRFVNGVGHLVDALDARHAMRAFVFATSPTLMLEQMLTLNVTRYEVGTIGEVMRSRPSTTADADVDVDLS
jgi:hypothetical protein